MPMYCAIERSRRLRKRDVKMFDDEVKAAREGLAKGNGTLTDVAQSRARRAQAMADLIAAMAEAEVSVAEYERVVGHAPVKLKRPAIPHALLPKSLAAALRRCRTIRPWRQSVRGFVPKRRCRRLTGSRRMPFRN